MPQNHIHKLLDAAAVSSTNAVYSDWVETDQLGQGGFHFAWTGTPTGVIEIHISNDPVIAKEQSRVKNGSDTLNGLATVRGASSAAKFVSPTVADDALIQVGADPAGGASGTYIGFAGPFGKAKYARVKYTNATGSGTLSCWSNA